MSKIPADVALKASVARVIDGEAWKAMEDGRAELEGSLWHLRQGLALEKAEQIIAMVGAAHEDVTKKKAALEWSAVAESWPSEGIRDVEAATAIGKYTISADQPAVGGTHYLWLAGNDTDEHDSEHPTMAAAKNAAAIDYQSRASLAGGTDATL